MSVTGASSNGYITWKNVENKTLKDVEVNEAEKL